MKAPAAHGLFFRVLAGSLAVSGTLAVAACAGGYRPVQFVGGKDLVYPPDALAAGIEGRVVVRYDVTVEGRVQGARIESASPAGLFEEEALEAVRSWRFRPMLERGKPVAAPARVSEVVFKLGDDGRYDHLPAPKRARETRTSQ